MNEHQNLVGHLFRFKGCSTPVNLVVVKVSKGEVSFRILLGAADLSEIKTIKEEHFAQFVEELD